MLGTTTLYFIDGPLEGQTIASRMDWLTEGRYTCKVPAGRPQVPVRAGSYSRIPMAVSSLTLTYKMVDEKLGHMKLEKVS